MLYLEIVLGVPHAVMKDWVDKKLFASSTVESLETSSQCNSTESVSGFSSSEHSSLSLTGGETEEVLSTCPIARKPSSEQCSLYAPPLLSKGELPFGNLIKKVCVLMQMCFLCYLFPFPIHWIYKHWWLVLFMGFSCSPGSQRIAPFHWYTLHHLCQHIFPQPVLCNLSNKVDPSFS